MKRLAENVITFTAAILCQRLFDSIDEVAGFFAEGFSWKGMNSWLDSSSERTSSRLHVIKGGLLLLLAVLFAYLLPTGIEFLAAHKLNPWLASVLFGDALGCILLSLQMRLTRTAIMIYIFATSTEAILFAGHFISVNSLAWITDALPTAVILFCIFGRMRFAQRGEAY